MEQTIKINVPEGKKAVYNESTQTIEFVNIEPVKSKSWEEFCKNHDEVKKEYFVNGLSDIEKFNTTSRGNRLNANLLATKEDAEGILALIQLTRLHDEWVGNWKHKNGKPVYTILRDMYNTLIVVLAYKYQLLQFPTKEMAEEFFNCFGDLIEKAKKFV